MPSGCSLKIMMDEMPDRTFDVGIAEQHAVTFSAGLATEGLIPFCNIYSSFTQRAYDQIIHDISIQDLDVLFAIDRAGLVGADGATHAGVYDYSFLRCIPGMVIMAPADEAECRNMLYTGHMHSGLASVRYPRGGGPGVAEDSEMTLIPIGKAELRRQSDDSNVAILAFGTMVQTAEAVAVSLDATVINMRFVKPMDESMVLEMARTHKLIVTIEENVVMGGAGSAVNECLAKNNIEIPVLNLGIPDRHVDHGSQLQQLVEIGLDEKGVRESIMEKIKLQKGNDSAAKSLAVPSVKAVNQI